MAEQAARQVSRSMNSCLLHLQKLGLELKCPLCLDYLCRPTLLPCDHIFCKSCLPPDSNQFGTECFVCSAQYTHSDLRLLPFMGNIVSIYRSINAGFSANLTMPSFSDSGKVFEKCPTPTSKDVRNQSCKESIKITMENHSRHVQSSDNMDKENHLECTGDDKSSGAYTMSQPLEIFEPKEVGVEGIRNQYEYIKVDQVVQSSPGSPPSSDIKGSDNDSNDRGINHIPKHFPIEMSLKRNSTIKRRLERHETSAAECEGGMSKDTKKCKMSKFGLLDKGKESAGCVETEALTDSNSDLEKPVDNKYTCAFCPSPKIPEIESPMLHFANGKQVMEDEANCPTVIHVHSRCSDWAPQVYYDGDDKIQNLKEELARSAKLKCSGCGQKGAVLGCYVKSCKRSYHIPCALKLSKVHWDTDNSLMLCPSHSSSKFPNKKSTKSGIHSSTARIELSKITTPMPSFWKDSLTGAHQWILCGSALSSGEKLILVQFASMIGATVTKYWRPDVSHVIAATDTNGACTRTLKVLMAICGGRWVLKMDWVKACMEAMHPVDEEPFELGLDSHGCSGGPKAGRVSVTNDEPKLFNGLRLYFCGKFTPAYKEDLQKLVIAAGASIFMTKEELIAESKAKKLIVYNLDSPQVSKVGEEVSYMWERLSEADDLAAKVGCEVVGHTWLLESIAAYKLQLICPVDLAMCTL